MKNFIEGAIALLLFALLLMAFILVSADTISNLLAGQKIPDQVDVKALRAEARHQAELLLESKLDVTTLKTKSLKNSGVKR